MAIVRKVRSKRPSMTGKYVVTMESRNQKKFEVEDQLDAEFLRAADRFQMKAKRITRSLPERRNT